MNILLAAATVLEIKPFLDRHRQVEFAGLDIIITGPGLMPATYQLLNQVRLKRPDLVIQAGIAGSFDKRFPPGSLVCIKTECLADEGVWEKGNFINLFDIGLRKKNDFPFRNGRLVNPDKRLMKLAGLKAVAGATVNLITTGKTITHLQRKYKATVESMEGAALHYVCLMEDLPFLQLRAISNFIGERDKRKWKTGEAVASLSGKLEELINNLDQ